MKVDSTKFAYFNYESESNVQSKFEVGDVVIYTFGEGETKEPVIGVVLAIADRGDVRTDSDGMRCEDYLTLATIDEINQYRPSLFDVNAGEWVYIKGRVYSYQKKDEYYKVIKHKWNEPKFADLLKLYFKKFKIVEFDSTKNYERKF